MTRRREPWTPVTRTALAAWLLFYAAFLVHATVDRDGILALNPVNFVAHEAGHLLFGWFGATAALWGGTAGQLLAPALAVLAFATRRDVAGAAFGAFWFFENWLEIAVYVEDARRQALPLVVIGDPADPHDWHALLSRLGWLAYDARIARALRALGWLGMLASVAWFVWRARGGRYCNVWRTG